ncbi:nicotinate-mononucleotide:5,6-dimethylbenzimidazole phosphoribosyltransferase CobT [Mycolicibacterium chubuense NBB4]|uniref:Nicotinate-mononucleotide:5, 6-dimethylbenzimidazole phosphoribosyltransferase CobT n=1 Tax=Mycolicibacterium chubuense (strain NBB4) TaxID=710421 RepID=I4BK59_MYCCN|nr:PE-PPE domain-containing protein [Mycolicibacterium chubuense]AFM17666.1 nicotinate-mononucleotide:5,6-dimethylbenzimidazole phosphoribosyltransferase CobT [Mycolicibacterium chubuense NBB4]
MRGILTVAGVASMAAVTTFSGPDITLTANVLTVTGYTALGTLQWDMDEFFQGAFCSDGSGNSCTAVNYLSGLPVVGETDGLRALTSAIRSTAPPTTVLSFSQGSLIASKWLELYAGRPSAPDPENLSFVLTANPLRKYGGVRKEVGLGRATPDTDYKVLDIAIEYDGAADFPDNPFNLLAVANAFAGFQYIHIFGYDDVDLQNADKLVWTDGNTTYVLIRSQNLPLLEPLRFLGLHDLADQLNGPLKVIIDSAYNRDYPNLVDAASQDAVLGQFPAVYHAKDQIQSKTTPFASLMSAPTRRSTESAVDDHTVQDSDEPDGTATPTDTDTDGDVPTGTGTGAPDTTATEDPTDATNPAEPAIDPDEDVTSDDQPDPGDADATDDDSPDESSAAGDAEEGETGKNTGTTGDRDEAGADKTGEKGGSSPTAASTSDPGGSAD